MLYGQHNNMNTHALEREETLKHETTVFGFWFYLMSDCLVFASLFATYVVLRNNTFGGPNAAELFSLPYVLTETLTLLTSSFTAGLSVLAARRNKARETFAWLSVTLLLGLVFLGLEMHDFAGLVAAGNMPSRSGFLSAYFTLVGTHGLHVALGALWIVVLLVQLARRGLSTTTTRRLTLLSLFWHFLDIIWILIFTIVYLFPFL